MESLVHDDTTAAGRLFDGFLRIMDAYIKERYLVIASSHHEAISKLDTPRILLPMYSLIDIGNRRPKTEPDRVRG